MGDLQFTSYNPQGWSFTFNVDEQTCSGNYPLSDNKGIGYSIGDSYEDKEHIHFFRKTQYIFPTVMIP